MPKSKATTYDIISNSDGEKKIVTRSHPWNDDEPQVGDYKVYKDGWPVVVKIHKFDEKDGRLVGFEVEDILVGALTWNEALELARLNEEELYGTSKELRKGGVNGDEVYRWELNVEREVEHTEPHTCYVEHPPAQA